MIINWTRYRVFYRAGRFINVYIYCLLMAKYIWFLFIKNYSNLITSLPKCIQWERGEKPNGTIVQNHLFRTFKDCPIYIYIVQWNTSCAQSLYIYIWNRKATTTTTKKPAEEQLPAEKPPGTSFRLSQINKTPFSRFSVGIFRLSFGGARGERFVLFALSHHFLLLLLLLLCGSLSPFTSQKPSWSN